MPGTTAFQRSGTVIPDGPSTWAFATSEGGAGAPTRSQPPLSMSSASRALSRLGLLLPQRYQAEGRQLARTRRGVFLDPPIRCCRVWQRDFSEFETTRGGIWRLSGAVDYVADGWRRGRGKSAPTTNANTPLESFAGGGAMVRPGRGVNGMG